jgi:tripartite-type tricarboxylate transporter receptor subunit TctC
MRWTGYIGGLILLMAPTAYGADPGGGAAAYPNRPIRLIVPYPSGSSSNDILGRALGRRLSERLGQQIVIDNRAGAGGNLGSELVAKAVPDGYTLLIGINGPLAIGPSMYSRLGYDPVKDLAPIAMYATVPFVIVVPPSLPATNIKELIALARAKPGQLNFAASGNGTTTHLCAELFKGATGIDTVHVPYKGGALAAVDLMAGQVQIYCTGLTAVMSNIRSGKLRALGIASLKRSALMPELPTISEQGVSGFEVSSWTSLMAPAGTPKPIIDRLHGEVATLMNDTEMKNTIMGQGAEPMLMGPVPFAAHLKAEIAKWAKVIKTANIRFD